MCRISCRLAACTFSFWTSVHKMALLNATPAHCAASTPHPWDAWCRYRCCLKMPFSFCGGMFSLSHSSVHCHFVPCMVQGTDQTHIYLVGGSPTMCRAFCTPLPSTSWWCCLISPFLPTGLESFLQPGQLLHCHYVCPSVPGSKLLGGEEFPHLQPRETCLFPLSQAAFHCL